MKQEKNGQLLFKVSDARLNAIMAVCANCGIDWLTVWQVGKRADLQKIGSLYAPC